MKREKKESTRSKGNFPKIPHKSDIELEDKLSLFNHENLNKSYYFEKYNLQVIEIRNPSGGIASNRRLIEKPFLEWSKLKNNYRRILNDYFMDNKSGNSLYDLICLRDKYLEEIGVDLNDYVIPCQKEEFLRLESSFNELFDNFN